MAYTDDFNRADGGIGANWTENAGTFTIASNKVYCTVDANTHGICHYSAGTFSQDQYSQCVVSWGTASRRGPAVRVDASNATGWLFIASSSTVYLYRMYGASQSLIDSQAETVASGSTLRLEVSGSGAAVNLVCYLNGTAINWDGVGTTWVDTSDAGYSGKPGLGAVNAGTGMYYDDWEGGDLAAGSSQAPRSMNQFRLRR